MNEPVSKKLIIEKHNFPFPDTYRTITDEPVNKQLDKLLGDIIDFPAYTLKDRQTQIDEAKQFISALIVDEVQKAKVEFVDNAYNNTKIMGKSVDEICMILSALDIERITDIKFTMSNLDKLSKIVTKDLRESYQKAVTKTFNDFNKLAKDKL